jgi:hypothetical protein
MTRFKLMQTFQRNFQKYEVETGCFSETLFTTYETICWPNLQGQSPNFGFRGNYSFTHLYSVTYFSLLGYDTVGSVCWESFMHPTLCHKPDAQNMNVYRHVKYKMRHRGKNFKIPSIANTTRQMIREESWKRTSVPEYRKVQEYEGWDVCRAELDGLRGL